MLQRWHARWSMFVALLGIQPHSTLAEKWTAGLGGFLGILLISVISYQTTGLQGTLAIVPSMGAAAVLLFAVPHGPLSQPWALFAGNLASALVGVTMAQYVPNLLAASALAVGLAIGVMHLLRCIHPPGGATALAAVIGGDQLHALGYGYVVMPTLLNCLVIFGVAVFFNGLFPWRRYPAAINRFVAHPPVSVRAPAISLRHIEQALEELDEVVDASPSQLQRVAIRAMALAERGGGPAMELELGGVYTNDRPGREWGVRQIIDLYRQNDSEDDLLLYRVLDGQGKDTTGNCTRYEFSRWAKKRLQAKH